MKLDSEYAKKNNELNSEIVHFVSEKGIDVIEDNENFERTLNLLKEWEEYKMNQPKVISILNSDQIYEVVLSRIKEYEDSQPKFDYTEFKDFNNNCR